MFGAESKTSALMRGVSHEVTFQNDATNATDALNSDEQPLTGHGEEVSCGTCLCEVPRSEATAMDCGHLFCNDCWKQHLSIQIGDGRSRRLPCMGIKCGVICDEVKARLPCW